ncbi:uncharacterized protein LOC105166089 isoform X2 [Sesamum indicum]|uniref:Uncharacterized protein LOC105166089 isoform X2 n=1 Tax=Sesamum indicum TaxID=4182 RepID=A0A6I9TKH1_SESIN|nr:uncharacterized protein LOC105166089 isoform X2 [Sesamum indicum]
MEEYVVYLIVVSVISWTTLCLVTRKVFPKRSYDFCTRIVSSVHASLAVVLASRSVQDWSCPLCPLASRSSPKQHCWPCSWTCLSKEMVGALWITEISSPFLHLREMLKEVGYRDTHLNLAADIAFALIFSMARMIGGPYLTYVTLSAPNPLLIKAMALGLQLVSAFWFYKIVRMVRYKLGRIRSSSTSSITIAKAHQSTS